MTTSGNNESTLLFEGVRLLSPDAKPAPSDESGIPGQFTYGELLHKAKKQGLGIAAPAIFNAAFTYAIDSTEQPEPSKAREKYGDYANGTRPNLRARVLIGNQTIQKILDVEPPVFSENEEALVRAIVAKHEAYETK